MGSVSGWGQLLSGVSYWAGQLLGGVSVTGWGRLLGGVGYWVGLVTGWGRLLGGVSYWVGSVTGRGQLLGRGCRGVSYVVVTCCKSPPFSAQHVLLGAEEGLFSLHVIPNNPDPVMEQVWGREGREGGERRGGEEEGREGGKERKK